MQSKTTKKGKLLSLLLCLALTLSLLPVPAAAEGEAAASFHNVSNDDGADVIALTTARSFEAVVPVSDAVDLDTVTWTLTRDESQAYTDPALYPNQSQGGPLTEWKTQSGGALFSGLSTSAESGALKLSFDSACYFSSWGGKEDPSAPHSNGGSYLDVCGYFDLNAVADGKVLGSVAVKIVPYDSFHLMSEIYDELDAMVAYAAGNTGLYVAKESMGTSSGVIYQPMDMPYLIIAKDESAVSDWLAFTQKAETDPDGVLADIEAGKYDELKVPVMYSNIHANEVAAVDGIVNFAWMLLKAASGEEALSYNVLTGFTAQGEAQLAEEMGPVGEKGSVAIPDLVAESATYLGYLQDGNGKSGVVDLEKYYTSEPLSVDVDALLEDVFFLLVPEENVEGRTYITRTASNGYDLNRDNSFQTTSETQNMQQLIAAFNPVSLTEFHGRISDFQCEPCDPPHEPNFEYDLLAQHLMGGGEALGIAAVANNGTYNSYVIPQRDYLSYTGEKTADGQDETYWYDPWDDMSTSYTPQFAMLQGTVSYTVELPGYNDAGADLVSYGCLGQSQYIAGEKLGYLTAQTEIFQRGVHNLNSDAFELVGQWLCDQYDVEGAEMELFRPEYNGQDQNGNFYPECYLIPLDGANQKNLQAAADMMTWLSRNDVKLLLTEEPVSYGGVTYPAGTMVVSMYQAKRSVANGALYDGTLITSWSQLYSEGITSFAETRGFDMATVAEPAAYQGIAAACGDWMDYEDCQDYLAGKNLSSLTGSGSYVILSNVSSHSTAAVNALLQAGEAVGMVTDAESAFYGDFVLTYGQWKTVSKSYTLSGTAMAASQVPAAQVIAKAPTVYLTGVPGTNSSGFLYTSQVGSYSWNYDRVAMETLNFPVTTDPAAADVILGGSSLSGAAREAVLSGTPYLGYGASATRSTLFGSSLVRSGASGMDCLGYVTYPETTLVNASYVLEGDDILYGYGLGYFSALPEGAKVLVAMDGSKTPTEGFLKTGSASQLAAAQAFLGKTEGVQSVQGFAFQGKLSEDAENEINVVLFANTLTNKGHQQDEYGYLSNFIFSSLLGEDYEAVEPAAPVTPSQPSGGETQPTFTDVPQDHTFFEDVEFLAAQGLMQGKSAGIFAPADPITRGQIAAILWRLAGEPEPQGSASFPDVAADSFCAKAVAWAQEQGVVTGYADGTFAPGKAIERQQLAAILYRYAQLSGADTAAKAELSAFADGADVAAYAQEAMQWACGSGILQGKDGKLLPADGANRGQAAAMLHRFVVLAG